MREVGLYFGHRNALALDAMVIISDDSRVFKGMWNLSFIPATVALLKAVNIFWAKILNSGSMHTYFGL